MIKQFLLPDLGQVAREILLVDELIEQATVRLLQHDFLQLFNPRSVVRSKVEIVGFHQTEISDDKLFMIWSDLTAIP